MQTQWLPVVTEDSAATSIFPEVEEFLMSSSELQDAVFATLPSHVDMDRYRSMMDLLFCSVCPEYRWDCILFYRNQGPPLREYMSEEKRLRAVARLLALLLDIGNVRRPKRMWPLRLELAQAAG
jgi:hypothetical protein